MSTAASVAVLFLILTTAAAQAAGTDGGISVSPVRVDFSAAQRSAAVTITNGNTARVVQVEAFHWRRSDGEDVYTRTGDLLVNPPLFKLAPGAQQVVRVGLAAAKPARTEEHAYRVYFQEVPEETVASTGASRLQMVLRLGVPVFVAPDKIQTALRWSAQGTAEGFRLQLSNMGNVHARLSDLAVTLPGPPPQALANAPALRYVFPGETSVWTFQLNSPIAAQLLQVSAQSESGAINAEIRLEAP